MIVVDVNILAFYVIEGDRTPQAHALKQRDGEWLVPSFWSVEFQSILWKYVRFGGMLAEVAQDILDRAITLFAPNEVTPAPDIVLRDALNWRITVYDGQYVSLARQYGVPCITADVALQKACPERVILLSDFIEGPAGGHRFRESPPIYRTKRKPRV
jgi:predicted nucleic acid-binding protein